MPICANIKGRPNRCPNKGINLPIERFKDKWGRVRKNCDDCRAKRNGQYRKYDKKLEAETPDFKYCSRAKRKYCKNGKALLPISKFVKNGKVLAQCDDCRAERNTQQNDARRQKGKEVVEESNDIHPVDEMMYRKWLIGLVTDYDV